MEEKEVRERVRGQLSHARFQHTEGVVRTAVQLAQRHGADVEAARLAAWLHDVAREWPAQRLQHAAEQVEVPSGFGLIPELLHGPIAASLAVQWYGVDRDIANAIRFHTTGRTGMSVLEKVVCLADAIEPGRSYERVEEIRRVAEDHLDEALALAFDATICYLIEQRRLIFPLTVIARNEFLEHSREDRP